MRNYKEIIKNFNKKDYETGIVNLHIHTTYSDGLGEYKEIAAQARNKGCEYISITDHNTIQGHIENEELLGFIIPGVEFDVWYKYVFLHLLAYGIDIHYEGLKKFYSKDKKGTEKDIIRIFANRNIKDLIKEIHKAGGIAVLAHPACCWAFDIEKFISELKDIGLDGIEVYYPYPRWRKYFKFSQPKTLNKIADKYNLIKTGGTDSHSKDLY